ncbi:unnamed protein product [Lymnaea stagnalis]|uniref:Uncharacterized protein n=1 Tax=Lymnaea stagnalis TaxID=6523 RepID=A0AAV2HPZ6_LYMST
MNRRNRDDTEVKIHGYSDNLRSEEEGNHLQSIPNGGIDGLDSEEIKSRHHYPFIRFSTLFRGFVLVDALVAVVLWLTGGDSKYFIDNIKHFKLSESVFDLALLSMLKIPVYFCMVRRLEMTAIKFLDVSYNPVLRSKFLSNIAMLSSVSFLIFVFVVIKASLILEKIVTHDQNFFGMHPTFYACVIWCLVSSLLIFILSVVSKFGLRKLQRQRVIKFYNRHGKEVDKDGKPLPRKTNLVRLMGLAKPEAGLISIGMVSLLLSTAVQTIAPLFFGKVVDAALDSMESLNRTVLILLLIYLAGSVFSLVRAWIFTLAGQRLVARLRSQLFGSVIVQEIAFFDVNRTGELCNRLSSDTTVLQNAVTVNLSMLFRYLLQIIGSLALMFFLNASLTGVLLAIVPVVSLSAMQYGKFVRKMRKLFQDRLADAGTQAEESLSSVRTVKSFSGEAKATTVYSGFINESYKIGKKLALAQGIMDGLFSFLAYGAISAVLWYGGKLVYENSRDPTTGITAGLLTSFLLYTLQVAMGFALLSSLYGDFMQAVGASARIFTLLDRKPDVFVPLNPLVLPHLTGEIEFKDVKFKYPSRPETEVLKGVSFRVERGQMVALVGPSGGGKSTIVNLIERFYDPNEGTIAMDGCDLKLLDLTWFRQKIAMVSQEPTLFACSIKDNIAYGREATDEEVIEAAKQANAHEFVSEFEMGYDTLVGERGVRLSGGQKQRIAIARALIMDPTLLLLDEATSALDAESEHLVQEAVDRAMMGRTVIVIAHRLSTVRNADKVVVIDKGQIAEMGTHNELLATHGVYKKLVLRQLAAGYTGDAKDQLPRHVKESEVDKPRKLNTNMNGNSSYVNEGLLPDEIDDSDDSDDGEDDNDLIQLN